MRKRLLLATLLLISTSVLSAQNKPKAKVPALVLAARYVYVTTFHGDEFDRRTYADERDAIPVVREALQKWGRYALTVNPRDADLLFVVRRGANAQVGVDVGTGSLGTRIGAIGAAEAGTPGDTLLVLEGHSGTPLDAPVLWRATQDRGFGPDVPLVRELRKDIEETVAAVRNRKP